MMISSILTLLGCISCALCFPGDVDFVVMSRTRTEREVDTESDKVLQAPPTPQIYEMDVTADVSNRFGKTLITSKVRNPATSAQEVTFSVILPDRAYISEFVMEIGGKQYKAYVKEKEEAKQIYNQAVASGIGAAHVAVSARDSSRFTVSVNVEAEGKAIFYLTYEELLERKNGMYEIVINIHPGQIVKHLSIKVNINESKTLRGVRTPSLRSGNEITKNEDGLEPNTEIHNINETSAVVTFNPDIEQQKQFAEKLGTKKEDGLSGQFVVQYDVDRTSQGGEVLVKDGYFVHFFAPEEMGALKPLPKHVVFVLDRSGSMGGSKMTKLKEAMNSILSELQPLDAFSIVDFDDSVRVWDITNSVYKQFGESPLPELKESVDSSVLKDNMVTPDSLKTAKEMVDRMDDGGSTNIIGGLEAAMFILEDSKYQPMIIFLTDGAPNVRLWEGNEIIAEVEKLKGDVEIPIFSLSFGEDADKDFLRKLSLKNFGFSRHIYVAADAHIQLEDFYHQISSPLLNHVKFEYVDEDVQNVTRSKFPLFFDGGEIVVAGRYPSVGDITDPGFSLQPQVSGSGFYGELTLTPVVEHSVTALERLWAYLTIKQKLDARDLSDNKKQLEKEALDLALEYSFVTPVSSLVVVKPNDTSSVDTEDASTKKFDFYPAYAGSRFGGPVPLNAPGGSFQYASLNLAHGAAPVALNSFANSYDYQDIRLAQPGIPSRPAQIPLFDPAPLVPTTEASSPALNATSLEELKAKLPWLANILNADQKLDVQGQTYKLGFGETASSSPACSNNPAGAEGECVLLHQCPQAYQYLDDFPKYEQSFCPLNEYAGICCPNEEETL